MRFDEIKCHKINSQYQLKNTSYVNNNHLVVKNRSVSPRGTFG